MVSLFADSRRDNSGRVLGENKKNKKQISFLRRTQRLKGMANRIFGCVLETKSDSPRSCHTTQKGFRIKRKSTQPKLDLSSWWRG